MKGGNILDLGVLLIGIFQFQAESVNGLLEVNANSRVSSGGTSSLTIVQTDVSINIGLFGGHGQSYNSCGCGGNRCEQFGRCNTKGFLPVCCNNVCKCIQTTMNEIIMSRGVVCLACGVTSMIVNLICKDAFASEFNCLSKVKDKGIEDIEPEISFQYSYFKK